MTKIGHSFVGLAVTLASCLVSHIAYALTDHSWVSSTGSGSTCTRALPCADFFTAFNATNAGGVISVIDSGEYGNLNVTKSIIVRAEAVDGGSTAGVSAGGGVLLNVAIAATDVVSIEGLRFVGAGINIGSGGLVFIRDCVVENNDGFIGYGIRIQSTGASRVVVSDTTVANNRNSSGGAGIWVIPSSGGTAQVTLNHVLVEGNAFGIAVDGSSSTGGINLTIADSMVASNRDDGIIAVTQSGAAPIGVYVKNTKSVNNNIGIRSIGPNATVRVDGSSAIGNGTGLSFSGGGVLLSAGNNVIEANATNGVFSGPLTLK